VQVESEQVDAPVAALPNRLFARFPLPLALAVFLAQIGLGMVLFAAFQEYVPRHLGVGAGWGGYLLAAYGLARFAFETPTGAISDRVERRLALLLGFVLMLPAIGLMAVVEDARAFLVFAGLLGLATAFLWPATYAISADLYPADRRGKVIGFLNLAQLLGVGIGGLAGAFLVDWRPGSLFPAAQLAVACAFFATLVSIPNYRGERLFGIIRRERQAGLRSVLSRRMAALSALILSTSVAVAMVIPAIRPYGEEQIGISFSRLTVALIPAIAVAVSLYLPAGYAVDRWGRYSPFFAGQALVAAGLLGLAQTTSLEVAMVAAAAAFAGNVITTPAWNAAVMDLAPASHRGAVIGLSVALNGLGLAIGPAAGGFIVAAFGAPAAFRFAAAMGALTAAGVLLYPRLFPPPTAR
jgi:MFS family permease